MQDGSYLSSYSVGNQLQFGVDINGSRKPNKLGHDIFMLAINKTKDAVVTGLTPQTNITDEMADQKYGDDYTGSYKRYYYATYGGPCNLESTREGNGIGCAYYALKNKCPYDNTKTYWECLP